MRTIQSAYVDEDLGISIELVTKKDATLEQVIEAFGNVLRGHGFYFDGKELMLLEVRPE